MSASGSASERRTRIADAALEVLAEHGARGLTHRAVDRKLGLPDGSTSYYFRSRTALLLSASERLLALDNDDLATISGDLAGTAELVERWLAPNRRMRALARLELLLTAARDPAFDFMRMARQQLVERVAKARPGATSADSHARGIGVVALVDGLLLHGLVMGELRRPQARAVLERMYRAAETRPRTEARRRVTPTPTARKRRPRTSKTR